MRTLIAASTATLLCLSAAPALAQSISDTEANSMLAELGTPAGDLCADSDKAKLREAAEHYNACQTALGELADARKKNAKATPGQVQVYDFLESGLQMGNTFAMIRQDQTTSVRVCTNIELQWSIANRGNTSLVGPVLGEALTSTKEMVRSLVKTCREKRPELASKIPA